MCAFTDVRGTVDKADRDGDRGRDVKEVHLIRNKTNNRKEKSGKGGKEKTSWWNGCLYRKMMGKYSRKCEIKRGMEQRGAHGERER